MEDSEKQAKNLIGPHHHRFVDETSSWARATTPTILNIAKQTLRPRLTW